jgi:hypothetical protein
VREPVDVGVELGVREAAVAVHHRELSGPARRGSGQAVADVDPADEVTREVHGGSS